jgi:hypothetical protein
MTAPASQRHTDTFSPSRAEAGRATSVVILVADGARPDALAAAIDAGHLPAMARMRDEGGLHMLTSVFPSVTGPAYTPFLMGRHPASIGIPGLRWYDRSRTQCRYPGHSRSYVGHEMRCIDDDMSADAPTAFELAAPSLGALSVIRRGLPKPDQIGTTLPFLLHAFQTHVRGDIFGWLEIDRLTKAAVIERVSTTRPKFSFAAFVGIDKTSHARGHNDPLVLEAMKIVDDTVAGLRSRAERDGVWDETLVCVVSDHGHSPVSEHDDLVRVVRELGLRPMAHPWVMKPWSDVAVMVSGNAMTHLYVELDRRSRPGWSELSNKWEPLASAMLARPSVDLMLLPHDDDSCEVRARGRGAARVTREGDRYSYRRETGDPLGLGRDHSALSANESYDVMRATDYPDALVQIASITACGRGGDIILSASREWDFREKYEPIPHVSSHGALHREHMLVPFLCNHRVSGTPRRTVDVLPTVMESLGIAVPANVEGTSFLR